MVVEAAGWPAKVTQGHGGWKNAPASRGLNACKRRSPASDTICCFIVPSTDAADAADYGDDDDDDDDDDNRTVLVEYSSH